MIELGLAIGTVVVMGKIADADDQSPFLWGTITLVLCVAAMFLIPLPFLRILLAGIVCFALMFAYKAISER